MTTNATAAPAPTKVARYKYSGPLSGATLNVDGAPQEVMLYPDSETELPEGHEYVQTLLALGYLTPVAQPKVKKTPVSVEANVSEANVKGDSPAVTKGEADAR